MIDDAKINAAADAALRLIAEMLDTDMEYTMALGGAVLRWTRTSGLPLELFFDGIRALDEGNPVAQRH